jgi:hypothetical protein
VPFVRFARDKRGYEYVYLVHDSTRGGGRASRPVVLYWYRTPPGVKVGRPPFDEEVRQRLEAQNPEIRFDWRAITTAQPPPPDAEHWRERRRAEKAAKMARLKEERPDAEPATDEEEDPGGVEVIAKAEEAADELAVVPALEPAPTEEGARQATSELAADRPGTADPAAQPARSRRRRRGRRRKQRPGGPEERPAAPSKVAGNGPTEAASDQADADDGADSGPEEPEDS